MTDFKLPKCHPLPKPIPLYAGKEPLGTIQPKPLADHIHSRAELNRKLEHRGKSPIYLDQVSHWFCAYPIQLHPSTDPQSFTQKIQEKKFANQPPHFGIPTQLKVNENPSSMNGVFYDQVADRFYAQSVQGGLWYLVGDSNNYDAFLWGISEFTTRLYDTWKYSPSSLYSLIDWKLEEDPIPPAPYTPDEADNYIKKFLSWLENFDRGLFDEMKQKISYVERYPVEESTWCEGPEKTRSFAYYEGSSDKVFFMPNGIHLLEKGEYEKVAQILAHERAHRRSFLNRLVPPSEEMLTHSLGRFLGWVAHSGWLNRAWVYLLGESTFKNLRCRILPILPEEELSAYIQDYRYAYERGIDKKHPSFTQDQLEFMVNLKEIVGRDFPPAWGFLASQYLFLAQSL